MTKFETTLVSVERLYRDEELENGEFFINARKHPTLAGMLLVRLSTQSGQIKTRTWRAGAQVMVRRLAV